MAVFAEVLQASGLRRHSQSRIPRQALAYSPRPLVGFGWRRGLRGNLPPAGGV
jgi:hypothetical protein